MVAGLVADGVHHVAPDLLAPTEANPKGFFESRTVQRINEDLLGQHVAVSLRRVGRFLTPRRLRRGQLWLARVEPGVRFRVDAGLARRMAACLPPSPFVLKDPRFCFTLPAWLDTLGAPACVVVFRDPAETAASILHEVRRAAYLSNLAVDARWAAEVWERSYRSVLLLERETSLRFLYLHYRQVLHGAGVEVLSRFLGTPLADRFLDARLHRSRGDREATAGDGALAPLYQRLCERAGFTP